MGYHETSFSSKKRSKIYITLTEDGKPIKNEYEIANIFNTNTSLNISFKY